MPSELGTSSLMPYLAWLRLTSGVTSQPRRLMSIVGAEPALHSSRVLYSRSCRSRHVNQYRLNALSVNLFGLHKQTSLWMVLNLELKTKEKLCFIEWVVSAIKIDVRISYWDHLLTSIPKTVKYKLILIPRAHFEILFQNVLYENDTSNTEYPLKGFFI